MRALRRLTLLGIFGAMGAGIAVCVGFSTDPPPDRAAARTATSVVRESPPGRNRQDACATASEPGLVDPLHPHGRNRQDARATTPPPGPITAKPHPALALEVSSERDDSGLQRVWEFVKDRLGEVTGQGSLKEMGSLEEIPLPAAKTALPPASATAAVAGEATAQSGTPASATAAVADQSTEPDSRISSEGANGEGDHKLSIRFSDTDIRKALELLSEQGNLNVLASNSVQGKVSATLNGVDVQSALDAILMSTGYVARRDGKFIFVGTPEEFETLEQTLDTVSTRVYRPNYLTAANLQALIQPLVTQNVGVVSVSSPAEAGIQSDDTAAGGDNFAGGEVVLVRDYEAVLVEIDQLVAEIDVRPMQVAIEAMILSVELKDEDKFGVNFELLRNKPHVRFGWGAPLDDFSTFKFNGGLKFGFLDGSLGAFLDALETIGDVNVIATPRVMVINKHRAEVHIGKQEGYINTTATETTTMQTVEFLDIGAQLRLRPFISSDGLIRMEIHPELSDGSVEVKDGLTIPHKEVTQVTTNIMVRDGCTVVIGGLIKEKLETNTTQIPLLGNLPAVGVLFRTKTEKINRHEVLVLITPHIVYEPETCREGDEGACEFHRRQAVYAEKMSPIGKRSLGRRCFRAAQKAWAAGDRETALKHAEKAVHFDPLNRAAIDLRSDIWLGNRTGEHTLTGPAAAGPNVNPLDGEIIAPWLLDDLENEAPVAVVPLHPLDPGQPGRNRDIERPRRLQ